MRRRIQAPTDGQTAATAPTGNSSLEVPSGGANTKQRQSQHRKQQRRPAKHLAFLLGLITIFVSLWFLLRRLFPKHRYHHLLEIPQIKTLLEDAPAPVNDDEYVVFVSNANAKESSSYNIAHGRSQLSAHNALQQALMQIPLASARYPWFKIDVVTAVRELQDYDGSSKHNNVPSWWYGLALDNWDTNDWVFLPDQVQAHGLVDWKNRLLWDHVAALAALRHIKSWPTTVHEDDSTILSSVQVLHTNAILVDFSKQKSSSSTSSSEDYIVPLYHGHRLFPKLTHGLLLDAAQRAGEYLTRHVHPDTGRMMYLYHPETDVEPLDEYGLSRHAGTVHSMAQLLQEYADSAKAAKASLLHATQRALDYLSSFVHDCALPYATDSTSKKTTSTAKCVWDHDKQLDHQVTKLGLNALTVLCMAEYTHATGDVQYLETAQGIADWIVAAQRKDGTFVQKVLQPENQLDEDYYVRYYQGQVTYALARLYNVVSEQQAQHRPRDEWKHAAELAATSIVERDTQSEDGGGDTASMDHWLLVGMAELESKGKKLLAHAKKSVELATQRQVQETSPQQDKDRLGSFGASSSGLGTATKTLGMCAVYKLLTTSHKSSSSSSTSIGDLILESTTLATRFQLQLQMRPETAMYFAKPSKVLGGFHASLTNYEMRIDYTHHNLSSFLCMAKLVKEQEVAWNQ